MRRMLTTLAVLAASILFALGPFQVAQAASSTRDCTFARGQTTCITTTTTRLVVSLPATDGFVPSDDDSLAAQFCHVSNPDLSDLTLTEYEVGPGTSIVVDRIRTTTTAYYGKSSRVKYTDTSTENVVVPDGLSSGEIGCNFIA